MSSHKCPRRLSVKIDCGLWVQRIRHLGHAQHVGRESWRDVRLIHVARSPGQQEVKGQLVNSSCIRTLYISHTCTFDTSMSCYTVKQRSTMAMIKMMMAAAVVVLVVAIMMMVMMMTMTMMWWSRWRWGRRWWWSRWCWSRRRWWKTVTGPEILMTRARTIGGSYRTAMMGRSSEKESYMYHQ